MSYLDINTQLTAGIATLAIGAAAALAANAVHRTGRHSRVGPAQAPRRLAATGPGSIALWDALVRACGYSTRKAKDLLKDGLTMSEALANVTVITVATVATA